MINLATGVFKKAQKCTQMYQKVLKGRNILKDTGMSRGRDFINLGN